MELRESESRTMQCNQAAAMTINRSSRTRGENWLVRAATQVRKVIKETYIVRAAKTKNTHQDFSDPDDVEEVETAVLLNTGETVKVKASDVERFLLENRGQVKSQKRERKGRPRESTSNTPNQ